MATLPAPRTSIQKCQIIERQFFVQPFKIFFLAQFCTLFVILTLFQGFFLVFVLYKISFASGHPGETGYKLANTKIFDDGEKKKSGPYVFHKVYNRCQRNCSDATDKLDKFHSGKWHEDNFEKCCKNIDDGCNPECQKVRI